VVTHPRIYNTDWCLTSEHVSDWGQPPHHARPPSKKLIISKIAVFFFLSTSFRNVPGPSVHFALFRCHTKWIKDYDGRWVGREEEVDLRHLCNTIGFGIGKKQKLYRIKGVGSGWISEKFFENVFLCVVKDTITYTYVDRFFYNIILSK